ncbi:MAG: hypothetical protein UT30_C0010G0003 [Candidatus Uhrbacteria bacterium GW2011_GWF2_39_13]|uniref:Uncharacterized protein n=1 Tax=Candidatus Uhrbacteria bacterium GW2011_GWF2_39_13 TaxID=1618995 RepID=A0A0G0MJN3_9BACT|nr:MAG: hypothetical protein UT30_C0010G0003 [Candidatus Uhrbacteria bacterium GW2011_GWF2_39_13]
MQPSMEEASRIPSSPKERPLDQFQLALESLNEGGPLTEAELHKLSFLVQTKYIDTFFPSKEEAEEGITKWIMGGFSAKFRDFWVENKISEEGGEGFRDLCLGALKEKDSQRQRVIFEELSLRLGDDMLKKEEDVFLH